FQPNDRSDVNACFHPAGYECSINHAKNSNDRTTVNESCAAVTARSMILTLKVTDAFSPRSVSKALTRATSVPGGCSSLTLTTSPCGSTISGELSFTSNTVTFRGTLAALDGMARKSHEEYRGAAREKGGGEEDEEKEEEGGTRDEEKEEGKGGEGGKDAKEKKKRKKKKKREKK
ncbi:unnamed protein product, partial [Heterotrigona itama]